MQTDSWAVCVYGARFRVSGCSSPAKGPAESGRAADKGVPLDTKVSSCVGHHHSLSCWGEEGGQEHTIAGANSQQDCLLRGTVVALAVGLCWAGKLCSLENYQRNVCSNPFCLSLQKWPCNCWLQDSSFEGEGRDSEASGVRGLRLDSCMQRDRHQLLIVQTNMRSANTL